MWWVFFATGSVNIKNYTTQIAAEKTLGEIQRALAQHGATAVLTEYDRGIVSAVSFKLNTPNGAVSFRMPANIAGVLACLKRSRSVPRKLQTPEQAARVSWRILKDWIEAQLAIVDAQMVSMSQVFLPYAQVTADGKTLAEVFEEAPSKVLRLNA